MNDTGSAWTGTVQWTVHDATSDVITPDPRGFLIGLAFPDDGVSVAVPRAHTESIASGTIAVDAPPEQSTPIGEVTIALEPGRSRTVSFAWDDQTNFVHLHCAAPGTVHPPGLSEAS